MTFLIADFARPDEIVLAVNTESSNLGKKIRPRTEGCSSHEDAEFGGGKSSSLRTCCHGCYLSAHCPINASIPRPEKGPFSLVRGCNRMGVTSIIAET